MYRGHWVCKTRVTLQALVLITSLSATMARVLSITHLVPGSPPVLTERLFMQADADCRLELSHGKFDVSVSPNYVLTTSRKAFQRGGNNASKHMQSPLYHRLDHGMMHKWVRGCIPLGSIWNWEGALSKLSWLTFLQRSFRKLLPGDGKPMRFFLR